MAVNPDRLDRLLSVVQVALAGVVIGGALLVVASVAKLIHLLWQ